MDRKKYHAGTSVALHYDHKHNPHAHMIFTSREVDANGNFGTKIRALDDKKSDPEEIIRIRQAWESIANEMLASYGQRINCRSLAAQDVDRQLGKHLGIKGHYARRNR